VTRAGSIQKDASENHASITTQGGDLDDKVREDVNGEQNFRGQPI
jgi:hypothetical protein